MNLNFFKKKTVKEKKIAETGRTVEQLLNDKATKKIGADSATYIQSKLHNWFTIDQLLDKTSYNKLEVALDILNLLCLLGLCYREEKLPGVIKYKITINREAKMMLLQEEIVEAQAKVDYLKKQLEDMTK